MPLKGEEGAMWQTTTKLPEGIFIYLHIYGIIIHAISFAFTYIQK
jgi:hypothetical protein